MVKTKKTTRGICNIEHGRDSKVIQRLQERINASPLNEVQKMEFDSIVQEMIAKSIAFDLDALIKLQLKAQVQSTGEQLISYHADLTNTQGKLADMEQNVQFHRKVLMDLKAEYMTSKDRSILEDIDAREKTIKDFERQQIVLLDLRNKIRKEIDKKKFQEKALELKSKDDGLKNITNVKNIDFKVLEE